VSHRGIADQALAAWVPTVEPQHVGGDCRLVDKYEVGRIKKALLPNPASARAGDVGALPLCRPQTFFNGDPMASEESGQRAAAARDSQLVNRRNDLIQREVRFLADEGENLPRVSRTSEIAGRSLSAPQCPCASGVISAVSDFTGIIALSRTRHREPNARYITLQA